MFKFYSAANSNLITVDIRPETNPDYVGDRQNRSIFEDEKFDSWYCDPPYNEVNALKM